MCVYYIAFFFFFFFKKKIVVFHINQVKHIYPDVVIILFK